MSNSSTKNKGTGFWDWGKGLAVVIALFVITTLSIVFYLVSLDYYMVSENHYEKAVEYQQQIDRIEHTRSLEKSIEIRHASQDIRIQFPDALVALKPIGTVRLYRPSNSNLDRSFKLSLDAKGAQLIPAQGLKQGKWLVQITWESDGREYFEEAAVFL